MVSRCDMFWIYACRAPRGNCDYRHPRRHASACVEQGAGSGAENQLHLQHEAGRDRGSALHNNGYLAVNYNGSWSYAFGIYKDGREPKSHGYIPLKVGRCPSQAPAAWVNREQNVYGINLPPQGSLHDPNYWNCWPQTESLFGKFSSYVAGIPVVNSSNPEMCYIPEKIRNSSRFPLFSDTSYDYGDVKNVSDFYFSTTSEAKALSLHHGGVGSTLWADGHASNPGIRTFRELRLIYIKLDGTTIKLL